ncbi:MAG: Hsp20/alpha crystallin family protein [Anaerolineae bacterium]|nr:MAG: Hsp20/alpha crystallin family protein [Anaerolineae bacterium]
MGHVIDDRSLRELHLSEPEPPKYYVSASYVEWTTRVTLWRPPTDVVETDGALIVRLEVAGMEGGEFHISVQPNLLAVRGVRGGSGIRGAYQQMEINTGEFISLVEFQLSLDIDDVNANYRDGFLTVTLPKLAPGDGSLQ